ncbi:MAG: peptide-methionine (R)-S-oxide reductase MsrB [Candidatus Binatia bacterium]
MGRSRWMVPGAVLFVACVAVANSGDGASAQPPAVEGKPMGQKVIKSEEEWRQVLTPEQFAVCRQKGTERAFTGKYWDNHEKGVYRCAVCGAELFSSDAKFDSGTGWPSFWEPINKESIQTDDDSSLFMKRTEVRCAVCGSHLGHVFNDGPAPTGLRYCLNSVCLDFQPTK